MSKVRINIDRPLVSSSEIADRQNFDQLLTNYQSNTPIRPRKMWYAAGALASLIFATVAAITLLSPEPQPAQTLAPAKPEPADLPIFEKRFINPPLHGIDVPYAQHTFESADGYTLKHPTGSIIKIPAQAFVDELGNPIHGEVTLEYREFHDVVDFFVSGIPMTYDSANTQYHFESAGMMDIRGFQDGKPIYIAPDRELEVEMASNYDGTHYNLYNLDTTDRAWAYLGKDELRRRPATVEEVVEERPGNPLYSDFSTEELESYSEAVYPASDTIPTTAEMLWNRNAFPTSMRPAYDSLAALHDTAAAEVFRLEKNKPILPKVLDDSKVHFDIDFLPEEFPELAAYKDLKFELTSGNRGFSRKKAKKTWADVKIWRLKNQDIYIVQFTRKVPIDEVNRRRSERKVTEDKLTLRTIPAVTEGERKRAMEQHSAAMKEYQAVIDQKRKELQQRQRQIQFVFSNTRRLNFEDMVEHQDSILAALDQNPELTKQEKNIRKAHMRRGQLIRAFRIQQFGIYNCDSPQNLPVGPPIAATYSDQETNKAVGILGSVYQAELGRNMMYTLAYKGRTVKINREKEYLLWAVTVDGELAIASKEECNAAKSARGQFDFGMKLVVPDYQNVDDVKRIFDL